MNKTAIIIPSRMSASRLAGKPLLKINNLPIICHVVNKAQEANIGEVYVATEDQEIVDVVKENGGKAVLTGKHATGSDRIFEGYKKLNLTGINYLINLQGDEPMTTPNMIDLAISPLINFNEINISNLYTKINSTHEFENPNEVKVVVDKFDYAIYFSREPIPSKKLFKHDVPMFKQVCVIPFRRDYLLKYNSMEQTELEKIESIDMLRVLENGDKIKMVYIEEENYSVDTKEDLLNVIMKMKDDKLIKKYLKK